MIKRLIVWTLIAIMFAWWAYLYFRAKRCQICCREFGVFRRRYKGNGLWRSIALCRICRDEWDAKYTFKEAF